MRYTRRIYEFQICTFQAPGIRPEFPDFGVSDDGEDAGVRRAADLAGRSRPGERRGEGLGGHLPGAGHRKDRRAVPHILHLRQERQPHHRLQGLGEPHLRGLRGHSRAADQRGHRHRGRALPGAQRRGHQAHGRRNAQQPHGRQPAGRVHHHLPAGQADAAQLRPELQAQGAGGLSGPAGGGKADQGGDPGGLSERHLPGRPELRREDRGPGLLRQGSQPADPARVRLHRGHHPQPLPLQPPQKLLRLRELRADRQAHQLRARRDAGSGPDHRGRVHCRQGRAAPRAGDLHSILRRDVRQRLLRGILHLRCGHQDAARRGPGGQLLQPQQHGDEVAQRRLHHLHLPGSRGAVRRAGHHHQLVPVSRNALRQRFLHPVLAGRRRVPDRGAAPGRCGGDQLAHRRTGRRGGRTQRARAEEAAQPRLSIGDAGWLVPQAAVGLRPSLRSGLFAGHAGAEPAH